MSGSQPTDDRSTDLISGFSGYFRATHDQRAEAFRKGVIVLDTNVLLSLYRFTPTSREDVFDTLEKLGERLWIPHQVAYEFHKNRIRVVADHVREYGKVQEELNSASNLSSSSLRRLASLGAISESERDSLLATISRANESVSKKIAAHASQYDMTVEQALGIDPILARLNHILDGKVAKPPPLDVREERRRAFSTRAEKKIPPGYKDSSKVDNAAGDYLIWAEILEEASSRKAPFVLVTNDQKEDWVQVAAEGFRLGARPELIAELREVNDQTFYVVTTQAFLREAPTALGFDIKAETVEDSARMEEANATARGIEALRNLDGRITSFGLRLSELESHRETLAMHEENAVSAFKTEMFRSSPNQDRMQQLDAIRLECRDRVLEVTHEMDGVASDLQRLRTERDLLRRAMAKYGYEDGAI